MDRSYLAGLGLIFNCIPAHAYWKDRDGVYQGCNDSQAQSLGLNKGTDIIGKTDFELPWAEGCAEEFRKNDLHVIESNQPITCEEKAIFNGRNITVLTEKIPLRNSDGEAIGVIGISMDISELKDTQDKLQKAIRVKSDFIANMSHDIRTPIAGISGLLQDLLYTAENIDNQLTDSASVSLEKQTQLLSDLTKTTKQNTSIALSSINELLQLCNEVLKTARDPALEEETPTESFNLRELIDHHIKLIQPAATNKALDVSVCIGEGVPVLVIGMRQYIASCLLNLLGNAIKFTAQGSIKIKVDVADRTFDQIALAISIQDSGIGIPKDKHKEIFDQFTRLDPSYKGVYKGSGLGLYIVAQYVKSMNASITVNSEPGIGSTFTLILPLAISNNNNTVIPFSPPAVTAHRDIPTKPNKELHILLVEDNAIAAMAAGMQLEKLKCVVDIAENGTQAIEKANNDSYDLIFMDVGLPDISGIEATRCIRALSDINKAEIPIVALTGHAGDEQRNECLAAGMNDVLTKPADPATLEDILKHYANSPKDNQSLAQP